MPSSPTAAPTKPTEFAIRPDHLRLDCAVNAQVDGEVITIWRLGAERYIHLDIGPEEPLVVKAKPGLPIKHA